MARTWHRHVSIYTFQISALILRSSKILWFIFLWCRPKLSTNQAEFLFRFYRDLERVRIDTLSCFGNVISCIQRFSNERVAVKILTIPQDQIINGIPSSILNHASILKDLDHPNIVRSILCFLQLKFWFNSSN